MSSTSSTAVVHKKDDPVGNNQILGDAHSADKSQHMASGLLLAANDLSALECSDWESRVQWDDEKPPSNWKQSNASAPVSQLFQQQLSLADAAKLLRLQPSLSAEPIVSEPSSTLVSASPLQQSSIDECPVSDLAIDNMAFLEDMVNRVDFGVDNLHVSSAVHADSHRVSDLAIDNMAYLEKMVKRIDFGVDEEHVSAAVHVDSTASENPSPIRMSFSKPTRKSGSNQIANSMSAGNNFHHDTAIVQRNWGGLSVIPANATNATNLPTQNPQLPIPSLTQRAMILSPQLKLTDGSWQRCVIWSNDELSDSVQRLSQLCINLNDPFTSSQMESKRDAALSEHLNPLEASGFSLKKFHQQLESMEFLNSESDPDYNRKREYLERLVARTGWSIEPQAVVVSNSQAVSFNFSRDDFYMGNTRHSFKDAVHSTPAVQLDWKLFPTSWNASTFKFWHRPPLHRDIPTVHIPSLTDLKAASTSISGLLKTRPEFNLTACTGSNTRDASSVFVPQQIQLLSTTSDRVVLCEYVEQTPMMLSNVGMASHFVTHCQTQNADDNSVPRVSDGRILISDTENPFPLVNLPVGRPISVLTNKMFAAPLVKHEADQCDFLLTWNRGGWMIRPISSLYLVGQVHPRMQVKCPSADIKSKYSEQRLLVWLQRHLNQVPDGPAGRDEQYSVSLDMLTQIAPELSQADIRKIIAKYCDSIIVHKPPQPRHEVWVRRTDYQKGLESEIQDRLKPEEVCLYEAMRVHELRLAQMGLKLRNLKTLDSVLVHNAAFKVAGLLQSAARFADAQLQLAPWNTSSTYLTVISNHSSKIKLFSGSNPLAQFSGFSYLLAPTRIEKKITGAQDLHVELAAQGIGGASNKLHDTEKDLRKLSKEELIRYCMQYCGTRVEIQEILKLERWPLVDKLRLIATETVKQLGISRAPKQLVKWARDDAESKKRRQADYKVQIDEMFNRHLCLLSSSRAEADSTDESKKSMMRFLDSDSDNDNNDEQPAAAAPRDAVAQRNLCVLSVAGINSEQPINSAPASNKRRAIRWTRHVWDLNSESPHKQIPIELVEPEAIDIFMRFRHDKDALSAELLQHFGSQLRQFMPVEPVSVSKSTKTSKRGSANKSPGTKAVKSKASKQSSSVKCTRCDIVGHNSSNLACPLMSPEDREARKKRAQCLKVIREHDEHDEHDAATVKEARAFLQRSKHNAHSESSDDDSQLDASDDEAAGAASVPVAGLLNGRLKKYVDMGRSPDSSSSRRGDCKVRLKSALLKVLKALTAFDKSTTGGLFSQSVNLSEYPDYETTLTAAGLKPIDLSLIGSRVEQFSYQTIDQFAADVCAIKDNSAEFNGAESEITESATSMCEIVQVLSKEQRAMFTSVASEIAAQAMFMHVLSRLRQDPNSGPFLIDPCKTSGPEYVEKIQTPTFLGRIQDDVVASQIKTTSQFVLELQRMRTNCEVFWGIDSAYSKQGRNLVQLALDIMTREYQIPQSEWQSSLNPGALAPPKCTGKRSSSALNTLSVPTRHGFLSVSPSPAMHTPKRPRTLTIVPMGLTAASTPLVLAFHRIEPSPSPSPSLAMIEEIAASSNSNQLAPVSASLVEGLLPTSTNL